MGDDDHCPLCPSRANLLQTPVHREYPPVSPGQPHDCVSRLALHSGHRLTARIWEHNLQDSIVSLGLSWPLVGQKLKGVWNGVHLI